MVVHGIDEQLALSYPPSEKTNGHPRLVHGPDRHRIASSHGGDLGETGLARPEREVFLSKLSEKIPFYAEPRLGPPGITGWAQVMYPDAASVEESYRKLQFDLYYIKHMSFFLDR